MEQDARTRAAENEPRVSVVVGAQRCKCAVPLCVYWVTAKGSCSELAVEVAPGPSCMVAYPHILLHGCRDFARRCADIGQQRPSSVYFDLI